jgi:hypothetical protein
MPHYHVGKTLSKMSKTDFISASTNNSNPKSELDFGQGEYAQQRRSTKSVRAGMELSRMRTLPSPQGGNPLPSPHKGEKIDFEGGNKVTTPPKILYSSPSASSPSTLNFLRPPPVSFCSATLLTCEPTFFCIFSISSSASAGSLSAYSITRRRPSK